MIPGRKPAIKSLAIESPVILAMISIGILGGTIIANIADEVMRPIENCLGYFFFCKAES